jgi:hypothetical protein
MITFNCIFLFVGHYKFTAAGQILQSSNNVNIAGGSFSFSIWLRRSTLSAGTLQQFVLNIGSGGPSGASQLAVGYRFNDKFTFRYINTNIYFLIILISIHI